MRPFASMSNARYRVMASSLVMSILCNSYTTRPGCGSAGSCGPAPSAAGKILLKAKGRPLPSARSREGLGRAQLKRETTASSALGQEVIFGGDAIIIDCTEGCPDELGRISPPRLCCVDGQGRARRKPPARERERERR